MTDHPVPADPPSPLTERGSIEDDIRVLDKALDEAIAQAVNLGALVRTDPRIKGTPMALEVKLRDLRASLRAATLDAARAPDAGLRAAARVLINEWDMTIAEGGLVTIALEEPIEDIRAALASSPAPAGLDVDRLAVALHETLCTAGGHPAEYDRPIAQAVAGWYARAATRPAEDAG